MVVNFNPTHDEGRVWLSESRKQHTTTIRRTANVWFKAIEIVNNNSYIIIGHTTNGGRWADDETGYRRRVARRGQSDCRSGESVSLDYIIIIYFYFPLGTRAHIIYILLLYIILKPGDLDRIKLQR